jgi:2-dehydro-3-deoxyphosphogluconate aldolase/(4S)-4-hydroxy-2-oxoglutarate aldolase
MSFLFPNDLLSDISASPLVAGFSVDDPKHAIPIARALLEGGVRVAELTLRTDAALESIELIAKHVPEIIMGVGTILSPGQIRSVQNAGAHFGVSPGLNPEVVLAAQEAEFPFAPGILTPSELEKAIQLNCRFVKLFPAESSGGIPYLKSIYAPYKHLGISFFPLGGIHQDNLKSYLDEESVTACGGSWLVKKIDLEHQNYDAISERCKIAVESFQ